MAWGRCTRKELAGSPAKADFDEDKTMNTFAKTLAILILSVVTAFGQLTTTSTTLSVAVAANTTTQWCVASATGVVLPSLAGSTNGSYFFVDKEAAQVMSQGSSSTCYNIKRGQLGTTASTAHSAAAKVWVGAPSPSSGDTSRPFTGAFINQAPSGACVAASQYTLPVIVATQGTNTNAGAIYNCINGQWANVSPGVFAEYFCGATTGTTTCPNTANPGTARAIGGIATLASNTAVISGISPAFTSTATFSCIGQDITTRANVVQVVQTSTSSVTITNTTGASDVVNWICVGY